MNLAGVPYGGIYSNDSHAEGRGPGPHRGGPAPNPARHHTVALRPWQGHTGPPCQGLLPSVRLLAWKKFEQVGQDQAETSAKYRRAN